MTTTAKSISKLAAADEVPAAPPTEHAYTYSIFDANPNSSSGAAWPSHDDLEIEAESNDDVIQLVRDELEIQAADLSAADGYDVGQRIYAQITSSDTCCIVDIISHELTEEDLA